jgi:hypothetical protein
MATTQLVHVLNTEQEAKDLIAIIDTLLGYPNLKVLTETWARPQYRASDSKWIVPANHGLDVAPVEEHIVVDNQE